MKVNIPRMNKPLNISLPQVSLHLAIKLFILGAFLALVSFFLIAGSANAVGGGTGTSNCPDPNNSYCNNVPGDPLDSDTPTRPKPGNAYARYYVNPNNHTYSVACTDWAGAGSWRTSANCNVNNSAVRNNSVGNYKDSWGQVVRPDGNYNSVINAPPTWYDSQKTCAPQGQKSAYSQSWNRKNEYTYKTTYDYRWERGYGWYPVSSTNVSGVYVYYTNVGCTFPVDRYTVTRCFWNYDGAAYYSTDRTRASAGWQWFTDRAPLSSDPRQPTGGSGTTPPNCDRVGSPNVAIGTNPDSLGYYRLDVNYNYKNFTKHSWNTHSGRELHTVGWTSGGTLNGSSTNFWVYSCRPGGGSNGSEGPFNSQGNIPNRDAFLNPATCPQVTWQCEWNDSTTAGLDRNAVRNGTISANQSIRVMRNGEQIPITFASIRVIDTSTPSDIDVTNGGSAPGIRDVTNIEYITKVKAGSTPFLGTDPNAASQYFKLYRERGNTATERFETWNNHANENLDKAIAFTWASDTADKPFVLQRQARVSASFFIPGPGSINSGGGVGASPGMVWDEGTYLCVDYTGRGASRVNNGTLTSESNPIQVVRATGK